MQTVTVALVMFALAASVEVVIAVTGDEVYPAQVTVRRGDRVRWQAPARALVVLDLEDHSGQHIVVSRAGSVAVTFLDSGPHPYLVRVAERPPLPGEVFVEPGPPVAGAVCAPGSNRSLCIEP
jgi:plastocyanin